MGDAQRLAPSPALYHGEGFGIPVCFGFGVDSRALGIDSLCIGVVARLWERGFRPRSQAGAPTRAAARSRTKSIQKTSLANEPCLDYSTAAVLTRVCRAAHAVASAAEAHFHVSKEALYTLCAFFSGPADVWDTCLTRGKVRGHVHAVATVDAC